MKSHGSSGIMVISVMISPGLERNPTQQYAVWFTPFVRTRMVNVFPQRPKVLQELSGEQYSTRFPLDSRDYSLKGGKTALEGGVDGYHG